MKGGLKVSAQVVAQIPRAFPQPRSIIPVSGPMCYASSVYGLMLYSLMIIFQPLSHVIDMTLEVILSLVVLSAYTCKWSTRLRFILARRILVTFNILGEG